MDELASSPMDVALLPPETWQLAFSFLDGRSHGAVCLTCSWWNDLAEHPTVWEAMCTYYYQSFTHL